MAIREILTAPDPRLREVSKPVATVDDELRALMDDMLQTMYDAPGIGLAAIQIGVPKRVIVMDLAGKDEEPEPRYFVNPEILDPSEEMNVYEEGCLSVPEYFDEVERPARCRVKYLDYNGNEQILEAEGLLATCIQHEMDHLEGVLFIDHLSRLKRDRVLKKLKKEQRLAAAM
ncbi:peptide deformylase [Hyphococcus sp.]|uniref:peptide deformylase n=1 Tax=Hyphococcus sp. TaxID=2038636 RepID=UPI003D1228ED